MAKKTAKIDLAKRLGNKGAAAHRKHRADETQVPGGGDLPPGIENGVAQLVDIHFGEYQSGDNKGELFFMAAGTVVFPESVATEAGQLKVAGLRTQIGPEPLCATPNRQGERSRKTFEDHYAWMLNSLRLLGAETEDIELEDVEPLCEQLMQEAPYFRFRTWQGTPTKQFPNPRVQHTWKEVCDFNPDEETAPAVQYDEEAEEEEEPGEEEEVDLEALAEAADEDNEGEEAEQLAALCEEQGIDPEEYDTWAEIVPLLTGEQGPEEEEAEEESEEEEEEEEEGSIPEEGDVMRYRRKLSSGKLSKKGVDVEVTKVFPRKGTCTVKDLDTDKVVRGVTFEELETIE